MKGRSVQAAESVAEAIMHECDSDARETANERGWGLSARVATGVRERRRRERGYISQVKLANTYDGAFIGRLIFELKANATAVSM